MDLIFRLLYLHLRYIRYFYLLVILSINMKDLTIIMDSSVLRYSHAKISILIRVIFSKWLLHNTLKKRWFKKLHRAAKILRFHISMIKSVTVDVPVKKRQNRGLLARAVYRSHLHNYYIWWSIIHRSKISIVNFAPIGKIESFYELRSHFPPTLREKKRWEQ